MNASRKESGEMLELRAKPKAVTRLNRKVIAILLMAAGLVVLLALSWGLRKRKPNAADTVTEVRQVDRVARAEGLAALPKDYTGVPKLGPPTGEFGKAIVGAEKEAGLPQLPDRSSFRPSPEEEALRAQRLKEHNEQEEAARASVVLHLDGRRARAAASASARGSESARPSSDADWLKKLNLPAPSSQEDSRSQASKQAFVDKEVDPKILASGRLQTPVSPHQLIAGTVISAALVTGIQSDLPGQVIATVTENVFDSVTGQVLLVPQGSRLLGQYDSQIAWGQSRVLLVWTRLTMPDGSSIVLDRLPGVDSQGHSGLQDGVDWHWRRIFAGAAVSTLLGAGAELASPERSDGDGRIIVASREGIQDTVNQVGQELTRRNLSIQPTLTERPGLPLKVIVNKDLILRPYGQGDAAP